MDTIAYWWPLGQANAITYRVPHASIIAAKSHRDDALRLVRNFKKQIQRLYPEEKAEAEWEGSIKRYCNEVKLDG